MCNNKSLAQNSNGNILYCQSCKKYTIEYKNLCFTFSEKDYQQFRDYFIRLDAEYWEYKNADTIYRRKVIVPVGHKKLNAVFNRREIEELQQLLQTKEHKVYTENISKALKLSAFNCLN